jgi:hypothetical protein
MAAVQSRVQLHKQQRYKATHAQQCVLMVDCLKCSATTKSKLWPVDDHFLEAVREL